MAVLPGPHLYANNATRPQAEPGTLGDRSTRYGGYWRWCRDRISGGCASRNELYAVLDSIEGNDGLIAESMWERMYADASKGKLRFGPTEEVGLVRRVPDLLEMRMQVNPKHKEPTKRHILRLYFAEPPENPKLLLALKFGKKPVGEDVGGTQDRHINDARYRLDEGRKNDFHWGVDLDESSEILNQDKVGGNK